MSGFWKGKYDSNWKPKSTLTIYHTNKKSQVWQTREKKKERKNITKCVTTYFFVVIYLYLFYAFSCFLKNSLEIILLLYYLFSTCCQLVAHDAPVSLYVFSFFTQSQGVRRLQTNMRYTYRTYFRLSTIYYYFYEICWS